MTEILKRELSKKYIINLKNKVNKDKFRIPVNNPFKIFHIADFRDIKMVIIGQDPYSTGIIEFDTFNYYYDGIAFSSSNTLKTPHSLSILHKWFKKTEESRGYEGKEINDLRYLVDRGIILINVIWTVSYGKPLSHNYPEWYKFTEFTLKLIQYFNKNVVFLLLGKEAQKMKYAIDKKSHYIFKEQHPAASRYRKNKNLYDSNVLLECMNSTSYPIRLLK